MANKKTNEKESVKKTNSSKKTTTTKKKTSTSKKSNSSSTVKKTTTNNAKKTTTTKKPSTVKKATTTTKKPSTVKKTTTTTNENVKPKEVIKKDVLEKTYILEEQENENTILDQTKKIDIISDEDKNTYSTSLESSKFVKSKKKRSLLPIGIIIIILGLTALIISLIANRIIDREFISDTGIAVMILISIFVEIVGAFIIINES